MRKIDFARRVSQLRQTSLYAVLFGFAVGHTPDIVPFSARTNH